MIVYYIISDYFYQTYKIPMHTVTHTCSAESLFFNAKVVLGTGCFKFNLKYMLFLPCRSCTASCREGYRFPNGNTKMSAECNNYLGRWEPVSSFPDCEGKPRPHYYIYLFIIFVAYTNIYQISKGNSLRDKNLKL